MLTLHQDEASIEVLVALSNLEGVRNPLISDDNLIIDAIFSHLWGRARKTAVGVAELGSP